MNDTINGFEVGGNTTSNTEGYIKTQDNSRKLQLDSNGWRFISSSTELMRLTPTGSLGIGNTNPSDYSADANNLVVGSLTGNNGITIASSGSSGYGSIYFADSAVGNKVYSGFIRYQHNISDMTFGTNEVERMRLTLEGYLGIGTIDPKAKLQVEEYGIDTTTTSSTAVTQIAIHTFPIADFRSARFTVQITNNTDSSYHSTEILAIHDGTTANITEFGEVHTGTSVEATFDADVSSTNFRLLATPSSTDSMTFKVVCHSLTV